MNNLSVRMALVLAAALVPRAVEAAPASGCVITIAADVPRLTIGRDVGTQLSIGARGLTPGLPPQLAVSAGRIEDLKPTGGGGYVASYYAPLHGPPQVAIVSAIAGKECGVLVLRLAGELNTVVRTKRYGAAEVRVGNEVFGPVRADASGRAVVPAVVPPGVHAVMHGKRRVPVQVPWTNHLLVVLDRTSARADRDETVTAHVFATTEEGAPAQGRPTLTVSHGEVSAPESIGAGVWRTRWRLPKGRAETSRLDVRLGSTEQRAVRIERPGGPANMLRLTLDRDRALAGDKVPVLASVRIVDEGGNGSDADFQVEAEPGKAGTPLRVAPGVWRVPISVPSFLDGNRVMSVMARAGQLSAKASMVLLPGPSSSLKAAAGPDELDAGGRAAGKVSVILAHASGGSVDGAAAMPAEAVRGELAPPVAKGGGRPVLAYASPGSSGDGQDFSRARMGALEGTGAPRPTAAGSTWVLAPKGGFAKRSGGVGPHAAVEVSAWKELFGQELGLLMEVDWWNFASTSDVAGLPGVTFKQSANYFGLLASVGWRHRLGSWAMVWASAGGGVTRVSNDWSVTGQGTRNDSGWAPALSSAVSAGVRVWRGYPFLELRGAWVPDPQLRSLGGSLMPVSLSLGYRFDAF